MRIAHVTDVHWQTMPTLRDLCAPRRILGSANLYLMGRRDRFDRGTQTRLICHLTELEPDLVIVTGDLTAQALVAEFELALSELRPVLEGRPSLVIPGNHDAYCADALKDKRFQRHFGPWMHPAGAISRLDSGPVTVLGLDPNRPLLVRASGCVPDEQLKALSETLADPSLQERCVVLALHYPILDRHGEVYDGPEHGLINAQALIDVLKQAPVRPSWIVHGHEHHGYQVHLEQEGFTIPSFDCGSSGATFDPDKNRRAAMNVYTVREGRLDQVERYMDDGERFALEPGGAYATGR
jgi:3',5'-cyclic AMP phosphodiesterase CpdA